MTILLFIFLIALALGPFLYMLRQPKQHVPLERPAIPTELRLDPIKRDSKRRKQRTKNVSLASIVPSQEPWEKL